VDNPPKSVTHGQCDARPTVTFPDAGHRRPLTDTKLYCLVTEAHVCEQLAQGCYQKVERPGVEPATFCAASQHTHTHPFNRPLYRTTGVSRYQKGKTNLDFTDARDSERQWHQLGHMQVCISLQTDNHTSTPPLSFLQAGCPSCHPTNSVKALKAHTAR